MLKPWADGVRVPGCGGRAGAPYGGAGRGACPWAAHRARRLSAGQARAGAERWTGPGCAAPPLGPGRACTAAGKRVIGSAPAAVAGSLTGARGARLRRVHAINRAGL